MEERMYETKKCKYCGKDINVNYMVCPLCGGHLRDDVRPVAPECPRCKVPLEIQIHDGDEYDLCPQCGGLWLVDPRLIVLILTVLQHRSLWSPYGEW